MSKKYHVRERAFLNLKTDMRAYVIGVVEDTSEIANAHEDDWKCGTIQLELADCHDDVSYEFDLSTPEERENSLYKIRKMAEIINAVQHAIEKEAASIETRQSFTPAEKAIAAVA
ncbi:MAG: hypothetical protein ACKVRN_12460 [Pyrinomonadaceae bacterium]